MPGLTSAPTGNPLIRCVPAGTTLTSLVPFALTSVMSVPSVLILAVPITKLVVILGSVCVMSPAEVLNNKVSPVWTPVISTA